MLTAAAARVEASAGSINDLNVFPVPDGDTGTNMGMTISGVRTVPYTEGAPIGQAAKALADAMLRNARGNSGVILSVFFKGMAKSLKDKNTADIVDLAEAMAAGVESAYGSVMNPTEGTILTVMREAAEFAAGVAESGADMDDGEFFDSVVLAASAALERTPDMLPLLKQAGVVDAGGFGFVTILKAMTAALKGEVMETYDAPAVAKPVSAAAAADFDARYPFCTECIVDKADYLKGEDMLGELKEFILGAGDSAVFVEDEEIVKIHVHTDDSLRVLSEAAKYGTLVTAKVENMRVQHNSLMVDAPAPKAPVELKEYGFAAVSNGDGICSIFRDLGIDEIITGGQTMNPSTEQILGAVEKVNAKTVFVFPNNSNIKMAAAQAAELANEAGEKTVIVIPTTSIQQGIGAMYAFDETADAESNTEAMTEAISAVRSMSVTTAVRDASIDGLEIKNGQYLGLIENKVKKTAKSLGGCLNQLIAELQGVSCVTIFYGEDVSSEEAENLSAMVESKLGKNTDVILLYGGQSVYPLLISGDN